MPKPLVLTFILLLMACQNDPSSSTSPSLASATPTASATAVQSVEEQIISEVQSWRSVEQAWERVHPKCKTALTAENAERAKKNLALLFVADSKKDLKVEPFMATPHPAYDYPVPTSHKVRSESGMAAFSVLVEGSDWHVVCPVPTAAGEKTAQEYKLSEPEQQALADKVRAELTAEQRAHIVATLKAQGKIAAIKELRKLNAHSLAVQKLVVEGLEKD